MLIALSVLNRDLLARYINFSLMTWTAIKIIEIATMKNREIEVMITTILTTKYPRFQKLVLNLLIRRLLSVNVTFKKKTMAQNKKTKICLSRWLKKKSIENGI